MRELPIIQQFELRGYTFTDVRENDKLKMLAVTAMQEVVNTLYPRDLLCSVGSTLSHDKVLARERAWRASGRRYVQDGSGQLDIPDAAMTAETQRNEAVNAVRHTASIFAGDMQPLTFAVQQSGMRVGGWQWYGIRRIPDPPRGQKVERRAGTRVHIRASWFPALPDMTLRELADESIDLVVAFVRRNRMMALADGRFLDIVQASAPMVEQGDRPETRLIQFARERLEFHAARSEARVDSRVDPTQIGRKRFRVTDPEVASISEPEIDALIEERTRD